MSDRIRTSIDIPADLSTPEAQAEILAHALAALGMMVAVAQLRGLQITLEYDGKRDLQIKVVPSSEPGDAQKLAEINKYTHLVALTNGNSTSAVVVH